MLLGTLAASLLGNLLTGRGKNTAGKGRRIIRAGEGVLRAGYAPHPLTNFEIQKYQNEPRFNVVCSIDKLH